MISISLLRSLFISTFVLMIYSNSNAQGNVMITTTVKNSVTTAWNCGCPKDANGNAFVADVMKVSENWNDAQIDEFSSLVDEFERINGVHIKSKSKTKNFRLQSDEIKTESVGPLGGPGKKLCDFLRKNQ